MTDMESPSGKIAQSRFGASLLLCVSVAAAALVAGFCLGQRADVLPPPIIRTDTLVVRDTVSIIRPMPVSVSRTDSILVAVKDTVVIRDTAFVVLEREQKYYRGERYEAWVSGYRPTLDRVNVFTEDQTITNTVHIRQPYTHQIAVFTQASYCGTVIVPVGIGYEYSRNRWNAVIGIGYDLMNNRPFLSMDARFKMIRW